MSAKQAGMRPSTEGYQEKRGGKTLAGWRRTTQSVHEESGRLTQFGHLRLQKKGMTHRYSSTPSKILVILD